jgi:hypothetical protein
LRELQSWHCAPYFWLLLHKEGQILLHFALMRWKLFFHKKCWKHYLANDFFCHDKMYIGAKQLVFITKYGMDWTANKVTWIKKKAS